MRERVRGIRLALEHRDFRLLWLAQFAGDLGDAVGRIALAILVFDETGSSLLTASVIAVVMVPYLGPGQALTAWAERFPRRSTLIAADVVRAACFAAIALPMPIGLRFTLLLLASLADPPFLAVRRALVPTTLPDDRLADAVVLTTITTEFCYLAGAAIGGLAAGLLGPAGVLIIDSSSFLLSAALLLLMRAGRTVVSQASTATARLAEGLHAIRSDSRMRRLFWLFPAASVGVLGAEALVTPLVKESLGRGESVIGVLAAMISVGVLAATAALRPRSRHDGLLRQTCRIAGVGGLIATIGFASPPGVPTAVMAYLGVGIVYAFRVPVTVIVGQRLADDVRAPALSLLDGVYALAELAAALGAGLLAELTSPRAACAAFAASTACVAALATALPLRRQSSRSSTPEQLATTPTRR